MRTRAEISGDPGHPAIVIPRDRHDIAGWIGEGSDIAEIIVGVSDLIADLIKDAGFARQVAGIFVKAGIGRAAFIGDLVGNANAGQVVGSICVPIVTATTSTLLENNVRRQHLWVQSGRFS